MNQKELDALLTEQEREAGFNLVYLPAVYYLAHDKHGILRGWYEMIDPDELADLIQEYMDKP